MNDPVRSLLRVLRRSACDAGCGAEIVHERARPWVTMTFAGARHSFAVRAEPNALARWTATLPECELQLGGGWFVASCAAETAGGEATIELLVLEQ